MAEPRASQVREGWGVRPRGASLLVAGFFGALLVFIAAVGLFYHLSTRPPDKASPTADPAPELQTAQRRPGRHLPVADNGPPAPGPLQAQAIAKAMQAVASRGDAGWDPPGRGAAR